MDDVKIILYQILQIWYLGCLYVAPEAYCKQNKSFTPRRSQPINFIITVASEYNKQQKNKTNQFYFWVCFLFIYLFIFIFAHQFATMPDNKATKEEVDAFLNEFKEKANVIPI